MPFDTNREKKIIELSCKLSFCLNLLMVCFGIVYFIITVYSILYDIFGLILIGSWVLNVSIILIIDKYIIKSSTIGKMINRISFAFIILFICALLFIILSLGFLAINVNNTSTLYVSYTIVIAGVLSIAIYGIYMAIIVSSSLDKKGVWKFE